MVLYHFRFFVVAAIFYISSIHATQEDDWTFPDGFLIGTATSSYQIEGAWNVSGKSENTWDRFTHKESHRIKDQSNGDIACDSYHKFKEDVQLLRQMGMDFYRFSISWSRLLPTGYANVVSEDGVRYYNGLINELIKYNIMPIVTIYHWDHPQLFQDMGGWTNEAMVDWFGDYARVVYREFGDRVKTFITINEPRQVCTYGLFNGRFAPGLHLSKEGEYLCNTNVIKAHAHAYHIYDKEFRDKQKGKIGITINTSHYFPKYEKDELSSEVAFQFIFDMYAHPIYSKNGDYPPLVKERVAENSKFEGLARSRLPKFSKKWIDYIKGTYDFLGLNHYTSNLVEPAPRPNNTVYEDDHGLTFSYDPNWPTAPNDWLKIVPEGFLNVFLRIKKTYGDVPVYVTENGILDIGTQKDTQRINYLHTYMKAMLTAIKEHGCNVKMYTIWSLMDNFEWDRGYTEKFGLYHVDFNHPNRTRTPKESVHWLQRVVRARQVLPEVDDTHYVSQY